MSQEPIFLQEYPPMPEFVRRRMNRIRIAIIISFFLAMTTSVFGNEYCSMHECKHSREKYYESLQSKGSVFGRTWECHHCRYENLEGIRTCPICGTYRYSR